MRISVRLARVEDGIEPPREVFEVDERSDGRLLRHRVRKYLGQHSKFGRSVLNNVHWGLGFRLQHPSHVGGNSLGQCA